MNRIGRFEKNPFVGNLGSSIKIPNSVYIVSGSKRLYIVTIVKHAMCLVNIRNNPARDILKLTSFRILRACYGLKIADKKPFQLLMARNVRQSHYNFRCPQVLSFRKNSFASPDIVLIKISKCLLVPNAIFSQLQT